MDNLDDSENNAKVSDSAYSNSCSNSHSRRSRSSKSTRSGSHSSGSSGYGGKQSTSGSSATLNQIPEKRTKEKEGKKKQAQTELVQIQADVEFRLPQTEPAPVTEEKEEPHNAAPASPTTPQSQKGAQRSMEIVLDDTVEDPVPSNTPQPQMLIVTSKPTCPEGFSCVISMHEGVVLYMSSSLTTTLGFPKELWIGRSFIDFIHPLDHNMFASQITNGLAVPKTVNGMQEAAQSPVNSGSSMFCRIRRYRGLETGFSTKDRTVSFMPFVLRLSFKNIGDEKGLVVYLVIQASPLYSAFKLPNEIVVDAAPFVMRHAANGNLEYIDNEAVPFLGYMPQDVTGQDMLKMYHPEDLAYVRYIYEIIVKQGSVSRSKPYRLMTQNGHYLKLETEWSSFINPWSRKLEFVIGKHYVVEGPPNPDVFQMPSNNKLADEDYDIVDLKESIVRILQEVPTKPAELAKQQMTKRCQDLASFMESLIEEHPKPEEELRLEIQDTDNSYYERDSVMLGGISPHHDYNDSKSSTGTPLSYNQLNFNINLKRYFDSHQESFADDVIKNTDGNASPGKRQYDFSGGCLSPIAFDSLETASVEFACPMFVEAGTSLSYEYQPMKLTESLLNKHNAEMEKIFVKKHRETRPANKEEREKMNNETKQKKKDHLVRCNASFVPTVVNSSIAESQPHGVKRASKPDEPETIAHKQHCSSPRQLRQGHLSAPAQPSVTVATVSTSTSMWPQNFVSGNPFMSQQISVVSPITAMPGFAPMYYVPAAGPALPCSSEMSAPDAASSLPFQPPAGFAPMYYLPTPGSPMPCAPEMGASDACKNMTFQQPAMQYMMYGQAVFGSPIMVSPYPVQQNIMQNQYTNVQNNLTLTTRNYEDACKPGLPLKPPCKDQLAAWREEKRAAAVSPLSSVGKGRRVSSICTATNALNRSAEAVPDSSHSNMKSEMDRTDGESSYSSFYSSFLKTESGSADDSGDTKKNNRPLSFGTPHIPVKNNVRNKYVPRRKMEPPWMEQVCVTSELIYKYQVLTKDMDEVLLADKNKLEAVEQPALVNEQLGQLYLDMQLEGVAARLSLEEGLTSSGSSGEENNRRLGLNDLSKRVRRKRKYGKLVMIYEENAPLPPPDDDEPEPTPSTSVG